VEFSYTTNTGAYTRIIPNASVPITWDNLRRLTIAPPNRLAVTAGSAADNFAVKLYYTENGVPGTKTIWFATTALTTADVPAKTAKSAGTVVLTPTTGTGATTTQLTIELTPTSVAFAQTYDIDYKTFEGAYDDANVTATGSVPKGSVTQVDTTAITSGLVSPLVTGEVTYRISGVDSYGFYLETVAPFTF
jgi:hypothetical protein